MIDGLKLTIPGEKLRWMLEVQIQRHEQCAARWAREQTRTPEDETEDMPLLPDHVEAGETYRVAPADLEFAELLPRAPEWLPASCDASEADLPLDLDRNGETDTFRSTRLDIDNGPEVIVIERK